MRCFTVCGNLDDSEVDSLLKNKTIFVILASNVECRWYGRNASFLFV